MGGQAHRIGGGPRRRPAGPGGRSRAQGRTRRAPRTRRVPALLALGGNVGDVEFTLARAVEDLDRVAGIRVVAVSPLVSTKPVGGARPGGLPQCGRADRDDAVAALSPPRCAGDRDGPRARACTCSNGPRRSIFDFVAFDDVVAIADDIGRAPSPRVEQSFVFRPGARSSRMACFCRPGASIRRGEDGSSTSPRSRRMPRADGRRQSMGSRAAIWAGPRRRRHRRLLRPTRHRPNGGAPHLAARPRRRRRPSSRGWLVATLVTSVRRLARLVPWSVAPASCSLAGVFARGSAGRSSSWSEGSDPGLDPLSAAAYGDVRPACASSGAALAGRLPLGYTVVAPARLVPSAQARGGGRRADRGGGAALLCALAGSPSDGARRTAATSPRRVPVRRAGIAPG